MGNCQCQSADIQKTEEIQPLEFKQENFTSIEDQQLQFCQAQQILQQETIKSNNETSDDTHRPNPQIVWQTQTQFTTYNLIVQKLMDELGLYEIDDEEGYFYGVYEQKDGSLYKGCWHHGEKFGYGIALTQKLFPKGLQIMINYQYKKSRFDSQFFNPHTQLLFYKFETLILYYQNCIFQLICLLNLIHQILQIYNFHNLYQNIFVIKIQISISNKKPFVRGLYLNTIPISLGCLIYQDGSIFQGQWRKDKANGKGRMIYTDGDWYEGDWVDDLKHGNGKYVHSEGTIYQGEWKNDVQDGYGYEQFADGSKYTGQFKNGKKNGFGNYKWVDGQSYEGNFQSNYFSGYGKYIWTDGRQYQGQWLNGSMDGNGIMKWPDGRKYEGGYSNDKKHGQGVLEWPDGRKYSGQWEFGKQHGIGEYFNGQINKKGQWNQGKRLKWLD